MKTLQIAILVAVFVFLLGAMGQLLEGPTDFDAMQMVDRAVAALPAQEQAMRVTR